MAKLNYKPANLRGLGSDHQLKPGINIVDDEVWKRWKNHPHITPLIDSGDIQVLAETDKPKGKPGPKPKGEKAESAPEGDGSDADEAAKLKAEMDAAIAKQAAASAAK